MPSRAPFAEEEEEEGGDDEEKDKERDGVQSQVIPQKVYWHILITVIYKFQCMRIVQCQSICPSFRPSVFRTCSCFA